MASIDRSAVSAFTRQFWDVPCPDNRVAGIDFSGHARKARQRLTKRGEADVATWLPLFLREEDNFNKEGLYLVRPSAFPRARLLHQRGSAGVADGDLELVHPDKGLLDCAHYVSQALIKGLSGVRSTDSAPALMQQLQARADTQTLASNVGSTEAQAVLDAGVVQDGDTIFYLKNNSVHHSAILQSSAFISCHTLSRHSVFSKDRDWDLGATDGWHYTIVHFKGSDDPLPSAKTLTTLVGWWTMNFDGVETYCHFFADGRVWALKRRPANTTRPPSTMDRSGYWFEVGGEIRVFFGRAGKVAKFRLSPSGTTYTGTMGDGSAVSGGKL